MALTAKKVTKGNILLVSLAGIIDEEVNWDVLVGSIPNPPLEFHIDLKKVTRINSIGVKNWIEYFKKAEEKKVSINYWNVSSGMVRQFNQIKNFNCSGVVRTFEAEFECENCHFVFSVILQSKEVIQAQFKVENQKCPQCQQSEAVFDEIPSAYLKFMMPS